MGIVGEAGEVGFGAVEDVAIEAVLDSWRGEGAVSLRKLLDVNSSAGTSVTIQAMFAAAISGVAFSREPNDPQNDELVVEATAGSGRRLPASSP